MTGANRRLVPKVQYLQKEFLILGKKVGSLHEVFSWWQTKVDKKWRPFFVYKLEMLTQQHSTLSCRLGVSMAILEIDPTVCWIWNTFDCTWQEPLFAYLAYLSWFAFQKNFFQSVTSKSSHANSAFFKTQLVVLRQVHRVSPNFQVA